MEIKKGDIVKIVSLINTFEKHSAHIGNFNIGDECLVLDTSEPDAVQLNNELWYHSDDLMIVCSKNKLTWDDKFIGLCNHIATWSKDTSTKVAAIVVNNRNKVISMGYNGLPIGVDDNVKERNNRPEKYKWFEHAERNAVYSAAEEGISLKGSRMYCNYFPCSDCARAIIQSGITEVIYENEDPNSAKGSKNWEEAKQVSKQMLIEARIRVRKYE